MNILNYVSAAAMPVIILVIVIYALIEKQKVFDSFLEGAKEGLKIVLNIFPTLLGLFFAIGALASSGILDLIIKIIAPVVGMLGIPIEIMPLAMLRPISGSAAMAIATDMLNLYGVDSMLGKIISTILGSTETTLYTIAVYTSAVGIKKIRFVLVAGLVGDIVGIVASVVVWSFLS